MPQLLRTLFGRSKTLNSLLGDVVLETPPERGAANGAFLEWRVKKSWDGKTVYVGARTTTQFGYGVGPRTEYISFETEAAVRLRDQLTQCIDLALQLERGVAPELGAASKASTT